MNLAGKEQEYIKRLAKFQHASHIKPILKGYSDDQKFLVQQAEGSYLVKIFDSAQAGAKYAEFHALQAMQQYDVSCSKAIELGEWQDISKGYMILSYIDGEEATDALLHYTEEQQLQIGIEAGKELKKIHRHQADQAMPSWHERKQAKHQAYMRSYEQLGMRIPHDESMIAFIDEHIHLMAGRPNLFQHDDYHPGNLVVKDGKLAGVIDFNRCDWGDPFHEFLKVGLFSVEVSVPFAIGQIRGYFNEQSPPEYFWRLYTLYIAMSLISSIVWIQKVKPEETNEMLQRLVRVMEDHHNFASIVPRWYVHAANEQ